MCHPSPRPATEATGSCGSDTLLQVNTKLDGRKGHLLATKKWDVFISHATEDKAVFVEPLAKALSALGVRVWYDKFGVKMGDSLSRSIDKGLSGSRFGVVVLSPSFLAKRWPEYELSGLIAREIAGRRLIIPIWHQLTKQQLLKFSPTLADKLAIRSDEMSLEELAVRLLDDLRPDLATKIHRRLLMLEQLMDPKIESVRSERLRAGPIRHEEFPADVLGRIRLIRAPFSRSIPIPSSSG